MTIKNILLCFGIMTLTVFVVAALVTVLTGCQALPQLADDIEKIATDDAIKVTVTKEAMQKETDLTVQVDVKNKDQSQ